MKPWIIAAALSLGLAMSATLMLTPLFDDEWGIFVIAAEVGLKALLPSLVSGYAITRFNLRRSIPSGEWP